VDGRVEVQKAATPARVESGALGGKRGERGERGEAGNT
jgi:hypothetical protein